MKKLLACILAAVMTAALLAGCGSSGGGNAATTGGQDSAQTQPSANSAEVEKVSQNNEAFEQSSDRYPVLKYAISNFPSSLAPWQPTGNGTPLMMAYECLMSYDDTVGDYVMNIGIEWNKVDDLHWEMPIHDNVYDSDGNNLTAEDVVKSYYYLIDSGNAAKFDVFDSVEAKDTYTLLFTWKEPITKVGVLDKIIGTTYVFTDKAYQDHNQLTSEMCGTGPYKFKEYVSGSKIVLEAKDDYWNETPPTPNGYTNVQEVQFLAVLEAAQNSIALQTGEIDFTETIPNDQLSLFLEGGQYADDYNVMIAANTDSAYFCANRAENAPHASITNDPNFSRAMFYALDNQAIADAAQNAYPSTSCDASYGRTAHPDHVAAWDDEENYVTVYDPELAKQYLDQTSYNGETLSIMVASDEQHENACLMIQSLLGNIGINVELNVLETQLFNNDRKDPTAWDMLFGTSGGPHFTDGINKIFNNKESGNDMSYCFIHDDKLQELHETAQTIETHDEEHCTELYHYVLDQAYYDWVFIKAKTIIYTKDIVEPFFEIPTGISLHPQGCVYVTE